MSDDSVIKNTEGSVNIVGLAISETVKSFLQDEFVDVDLKFIESNDELMDLWDQISAEKFDLVLCGSDLGVSFPQEVGQLFSMELPETPLYFVGDKTSSMRVDELIKNGFHDVFLYPLDKDILREKFSKNVGRGLKAGTMVPVEPIHLSPDKELPYDLHVFLPLNNKYIKYGVAGQPLGEERLERLLKSEVHHVFIRSWDYDKYYKETKENVQELLETSQNPKASKEVVKKTIRKLVISLFDVPDEEKYDPILTIEECQDVVFEFVSKNCVGQIFPAFKSSLGSMDSYYDKAREVATLAALLAISMEYDKPNEIMIAAFMQDVSLWNHEDYHIGSSGEVSEEYKKHPQKSLELVKKKISGLSKESEKIILQHHERADGTGFPNKLKGKELCVGAQVLHFINQLYDLTATKEGKRRYKFEEALSLLRGSGLMTDDIEAKVFDALYSK